MTVTNIIINNFVGRKTMKGHLTTAHGEIVIENEVIAKYAGITAIENFGIVGMASVNMKEGIVNLLKRDNVSKGVNVSVEDNHITIEFHIIVAYGVSIAAVTENLISNVRYKVEQFTGMKVDNICVYVEGVKNLD
jgi:uncharacterized alkaline shock family protein YloU